MLAEVSESISFSELLTRLAVSLEKYKVSGLTVMTRQKQFFAVSD
jgi:hypothetical protein